MTKKPALLLLPNLLGNHKHHEIFLPPSVDRAVASIDGLIAESAGEGRRYLGRFQTDKPAHNIPLALYNKKTPVEEIDFLLDPIRQGERWGYVVDAGLPCISDPGSQLVHRARKLGIAVQAFTGPSSVMYALMLSGLNSQKFTFHGYLDRDSQPLKSDLQRLERLEGVQVFIEAPHRNRQLLETAMETLKDSTVLCAAWDLTMPTQGIFCEKVSTWKKSPLPNLDKKPTIFLISSDSKAF